MTEQPTAADNTIASINESPIQAAKLSGEASGFPALGICVELGAALSARDIHQPTEIQALTIPRLLAGESLAFQSATGTGKTFAYLLPMIQNAVAFPNPRRAPLILICAPTYELAAQIKKEADGLLKAMASEKAAALLTGDANIGRQIDKLKHDKPLLVVGTAGRLIQLARMGKLNLTSIEFLVLDEADRLASVEMATTTRDLVALLPVGRINAACSATLPAKAREFIAGLLDAGIGFVHVDDGEVLRTKIDHWAIFSEGRRKIDTLRAFVAASGGKKFLVFTDRNGQVANICGRLLERGLPTAGLFGDMDKVARKKAIDDFRAGRVVMLVTSDLAARGLDITGVDHVVALDVPPTPTAYAHRAGRTGRAGGRGVMTTIGDAVELPRLAALEKQLKLTVHPKVLYGGQLRAPPSDLEPALPQERPSAPELRPRRRNITSN